LLIISAIPLLAILILSSPFQRWILAPYLKSTERHSMDMGITEKNKINPPENEIEIEYVRPKSFNLAISSLY
jgi:hypothetical protein